MKVVSVINYKGGVGKTTVTSNIAAVLAFRGKRVLLIDIDPQASLTFSFISPEHWEKHLKDTLTIKSFFDKISQRETPPPLIALKSRPQKIHDFLSKHHKKGSIDLISSHLGLINIDLELSILLGGVNLSQTRLNYLKVHGELKKSLQSLYKENYDVILIDCPPNFNIVTKNAILASDHILIPTKPDYLSTLGIDYLLNNLNGLIKEYNEFASLDENTPLVNPSILGVVFTMIQIHGGTPIAAQQQFISQIQRHNIPSFKSFIRENKSLFSSAPQHGIPVILTSNNAHRDLIKEMVKFVDEFQLKTGI